MKYLKSFNESVFMDEKSSRIFDILKNAKDEKSILIDNLNNDIDECMLDLTDDFKYDLSRPTTNMELVINSLVYSYTFYITPDLNTWDKEKGTSTWFSQINNLKESILSVKIYIDIY